MYSHASILILYNVQLSVYWELGPKGPDSQKEKCWLLLEIVLQYTENPLKPLKTWLTEKHYHSLGGKCVLPTLNQWDTQTEQETPPVKQTKTVLFLAEKLCSCRILLFPNKRFPGCCCLPAPQLAASEGNTTQFCHKRMTANLKWKAALTDYLVNTVTYIL